MYNPTGKGQTFTIKDTSMLVNTEDIVPLCPEVAFMSETSPWLHIEQVYRLFSHNGLNLQWLYDCVSSAIHTYDSSLDIDWKEDKTYGYINSNSKKMQRVECVR